MEPQVGGPIVFDFGLYSSRGGVFAVVGDEDACAGAYAGAHDDGLEQPAHGVFGAVVAGAGVAAAGGAAVLAPVDAAECGAVAGAKRAIAAGCGLYFYAERVKWSVEPARKSKCGARVRESVRVEEDFDGA